MLKTCIRCGVSKQRTDYYGHAAMSDGKLGACKECVKARVRQHYRDTIEARREYEKKRNATPRRKAHFRDALVKHRARHPERNAARVATNNAIRDGRLIRQPCEKCGSSKSQAHHDDYSKPLEVRWLCKPHHDEHHGKTMRAKEIDASP